MQKFDKKNGKSQLYAAPDNQEVSQEPPGTDPENMISINSKRFGDMKFSVNSVVMVMGGLIGLDGHESFVIIHDQPFFWLQSIDNPDLALVMLDPLSFKPDYDPPIPMSVTRDLDIQAAEELSVYVIVTIPVGKPQDMTANLLAPMIFNTRSRLAKQLVLDERHYSHRFKVIATQE